MDSTRFNLFRDNVFPTNNGSDLNRFFLGGEKEEEGDFSLNPNGTSNNIWSVYF